MAERLGALGNLNRDEFDKLSLGVQGQNNATDIFGLYRATPVMYSLLQLVSLVV